jgi:hypothetical protein
LQTKFGAFYENILISFGLSDFDPMNIDAADYVTVGTTYYSSGFIFGWEQEKEAPPKKTLFKA